VAALARAVIIFAISDCTLRISTTSWLIYFAAHYFYLYYSLRDLLDRRKMFLPTTQNNALFFGQLKTIFFALSKRDKTHWLLLIEDTHRLHYLLAGFI